MTPQRAKELIPILQAIERGETVQKRNTAVCDKWESMPPSGEYFSSRCEYRIKPKPKLRAWTKSEAMALPIDTIVKRADESSARLWLIAEVDEQGARLLTDRAFPPRHTSFSELFRLCLYSTDHGGTWKHCGVEVNES